MKNIFWPSLLAVSAALIAGCHGGESPAVSSTPQTVQAHVVESVERQVPSNLASTGTVQARESAVVSAQV